MNSGEVVLDFSRDSVVQQQLRKQYTDRRLFGVLALICGTLLIAFPLLDGFSFVDMFPLALGGWLGFRGGLALASLRGFYETNPGLQVREDGIVLPWRGARAAKLGQDNLLPFREIVEVRIPPQGRRLPVVVVRRTPDGNKPFPIEARWIPDVSAFAAALDGKVSIRRPENA